MESIQGPSHRQATVLSPTALSWKFKSVLSPFLGKQLAIRWYVVPSAHIIQSFVRKCQCFNKPLNSPSQHGLHHWHFAGP